MIDYQDLLLDPLHDALGTPATLTLDDTDATELAITAIDRTAGKSVRAASDVDVETIGPHVVVRLSDLESVDLAGLRGLSLSVNGRNWKIRSHELKPTPAGVDAGEIILKLQAA